MGTVPVGAAGGAVTGQKNMGLPVLGSSSGRNGLSPITSGSIPSSPMAGPVNGVNKPIASPIASAGVTGQPPGSGTAFTGPNKFQALGTSAAPAGTPTATATGATGTPAAPANDGNTLAGYTPQQTQQLQKQLTDIYGKGEGGLIGSLLSNLGSNDSSYMQAYQAAMSKSTAEGQATLDTSLGNAGISANSSAAAIEKADYQSGVTSQEGLQEQQLLQTQQGEALQLTEGLEGASTAENSTSWLTTAAQVGQTIGTYTSAAGDLLTGGGGGGGGTIPTLNGSGAGAQLPGAISGGYAGPMPVSIG